MEYRLQENPKKMMWRGIKKWDILFALSWQMELFPTETNIKVGDYYVDSELWKYIRKSSSWNVKVFWKYIVANEQIHWDEIVLPATMWHIWRV